MGKRGCGGGWRGGEGERKREILVSKFVWSGEGREERVCQKEMGGKKRDEQKSQFFDEILPPTSSFPFLLVAVLCPSKKQT